MRSTGIVLFFRFGGYTETLSLTGTPDIDKRLKC